MALPILNRPKSLGWVHGTAARYSLERSGPALLRFILAGFWIAHWWYKVGYRGMPATQAFFSQYGLPVWLAWFDVGFEVVVALCLVLGVDVSLLCLISLPILFASMWIYRRNRFIFRPEVSSFRCYASPNCPGYARSRGFPPISWRVAGAAPSRVWCPVLTPAERRNRLDSSKSHYDMKSSHWP